MHRTIALAIALVALTPLAASADGRTPAAQTHQRPPSARTAASCALPYCLIDGARVAIERNTRATP